MGCSRKERVRRENLPAVPEGPAANWGLRTGGTEALRVDPTFTAERLFWESSRLPERLGRRRGGWTERRSLGARARRATCVIESFFCLEDGRLLSAPSPWGASCGCEACGVWPREAQTLRICCYSAPTGSYLFWGRGSLGCLGLTLNFERILMCDWRGGFMLSNVGDMRAGSICWVLQFLILNAKIVTGCMIC